MAGQGGYGITVTGEANFTATTGIGEVTSISLPEVTIGDIDVSSFDSASNFMEYVGGQKEPGVIDFELNYAKATDAALILALGDANEKWTITFPDDSTWASKGYINKMAGGSTDPNGKISRVVSIKCSGVPTHIV